MTATIEEFYGRRVHHGRGQPQVILCERGIRTFERATRNTLDLWRSRCQELTHLPVIVDPSHATGHWIRAAAARPRPPSAPTAS